MTAQRCADCGTGHDANGTPCCACSGWAAAGPGAGPQAPGPSLYLTPPLPHSGPSTARPVVLPPGTVAPGPDDADLELFSQGGAVYAHEPLVHAEGRAQPRRRRRRPPAALFAGGGVVAVVVAGMLISSMLGGEGDNKDRALPDPTAPATVQPTGFPSLSTSASASTFASASASASASSSSSSSFSANSPNGTPGESPSAGPATEAASPSATGENGGAGTPSPSSSDGGQATVLSEGDTGSEVVELQDRLKQEGMYGAALDGVYDANVRNAVARYQRLHKISGDDEGVYGPNTRRMLEAGTEAP